MRENSHLFPPKDQPLLYGWYAFFFFDALLYAGDLVVKLYISMIGLGFWWSGEAILGGGKEGGRTL